jgi:hypothetical protein
VTVQNYTAGLLTSVTMGSGSLQAATWSYQYDLTTLGPA